MKKLKILALIICLIMLSSSIPAFAADEYEEPTESVFVDNVELLLPESMPESVREHLLSDVYGGEYSSQMMARGILCTLFGHDIINGRITVITHYARQTGAAKCYREYRDTQSCSRCDYYWYSGLYGGAYIVCCP
ncbi:MAG: hypothetical protein LBS36_05450 [Oscillospiraceae bacterium]|nr:hypothetical protein [Oscillospiraceae bacterium]